jgi:hypothetical protein
MAFDGGNYCHALLWVIDAPSSATTLAAGLTHDIRRPILSNSLEASARKLRPRLRTRSSTVLAAMILPLEQVPRSRWPLQLYLLAFRVMLKPHCLHLRLR